MKFHSLLVLPLLCVLAVIFINQVDVINAGTAARAYPSCTNIFIPSINCKNIKDGTYPNPLSPCSSIFFYCSNFNSYCYDCPLGLYYNFLLERCEFFEDVPACTAGTVTIPITTPTTTTTRTTTTTTLPSTTKSTVLTTTATDSTVITTTQIKPTVTSPSGSTFSCPAGTPNGFFHIPNTCGRDYYSCISGSPYVLQCPPSSIFDPLLLFCVPESQASCKVGNFDCTGKIDGFYAIPGQCTAQHHICISQTLFIQTCPGGSLFDPVKLYCVSIKDISCKP